MPLDVPFWELLRQREGWLSPRPATYTLQVGVMSREDERRGDMVGCQEEDRRKTMAAEMTIGEVARQVRVAASAIRYYEEIGLLPAPARVNGRRRYDWSAVQRL